MFLCVYERVVKPSARLISFWRCSPNVASCELMAEVCSSGNSSSRTLHSFGRTLRLAHEHGRNFNDVMAQGRQLLRDRGMIYGPVSVWLCPCTDALLQYALRETLDDTAAHYSTWMLALSDVCAATAACTVRSRPPDGARSFMSLYSLSSGITFKYRNKERKRERERARETLCACSHRASKVSMYQSLFKARP
jgi:hypothetical protein